MATQRMKALAALDYGAPDSFEVIELAVPEPGPGQIQVRIEAATINPTDLRVVGGAYRSMVEIEFPYVPGNDFAGTVTAIGPGATRYAIGDALFGQALPRQLRMVAAPERPSLSTGALAQYAVFEADTALIARRPASVPVEQAAALAIPGMTAQAVVKIAAMQASETAFVIGATGGVGTTLLPLLARAGVRTVATARAGEGRDLVTRLGAAEVVGHDPAGYPHDVDVIFNLALPADQLAQAAKSLRPGGKLVTIMFPAPTPEQLGRDDIELHFMLDMDGTYGGMRPVADAAGDGSLTVEIAAVYPFDRATDAVIAYATDKPLGKLVVRL